jgi:hypothetical protein
MRILHYVPQTASFVRGNYSYFSNFLRNLFNFKPGEGGASKRFRAGSISIQDLTYKVLSVSLSESIENSQGLVFGALIKMPRSDDVLYKEAREHMDRIADYIMEHLSLNIISVKVKISLSISAVPACSTVEPDGFSKRFDRILVGGLIEYD